MNVAKLPGQFFLDTNVLVYTFDDTAPKKRDAARKIVAEALRSGRGVISTQVMQEFLNVSLRKFSPPMSTADARRYLHTVLLPMCQHYPSASFYDTALLIMQEGSFSFYDALIVAAAVESECATLLSEDMQDGLTVRGMKIVNPFAA